MGSGAAVAATDGSIGIRARLWLNARELHFPQASHWLWLALNDGRVLAFRIVTEGVPDEHWLPIILAAVSDDPRGRVTEVPLPGGLVAIVLYAAPVLPLMGRRHAGWLARAEVRFYVQCLDPEIWELLGMLEEPLDELGYHASVRNYNRLVQLPQEGRRRRVQALRRFPALVAPLLLTCHSYPNIEVGGRHARRKPDVRVEEAIDAGRDLTGALACHWGISRALVRSPVNAQWWSCDVRLRRVWLALLDALPANQRPASTHEWIRHRAALYAYGYLLADGPMAAELGRIPAVVHRRAFAGGFSACFEQIAALARTHPHLTTDCHDFLQAAALRAAVLARAQHAPDRVRMAQGWLMAHGLTRLYAASVRWHAGIRPVDEDADITLPPVVGEWRAGPYHAVEFLTRSDYVREGKQMQHCVADYWFDAEDGDRTFAISGEGGERGTAHYAAHSAVPGFPYGLCQLRGARNAACSQAMQHFAEALEAEINRPERVAARTAAYHHMDDFPGGARRNGSRRIARARPLDPKGEHQLRAALAAMGLLPKGDERLLCATVAGLLYHDGPEVLGRLRSGDALTLVREPDNPHDALAVRIDWRGHRLGYIPRACNAEVAAALEAGEALSARIVHLDPRAPMWRRVEFIVDRVAQVR